MCMCLCFCFCFCFCPLCLCLCLCLCLYACVSVFVSLCPCLCVCVSMLVSLCLCLCVCALCLCLSELPTFVCIRSRPQWHKYWNIIVVDGIIIISISSFSFGSLWTYYVVNYTTHCYRPWLTTNIETYQISNTKYFEIVSIQYIDVNLCVLSSNGMVRKKHVHIPTLHYLRLNLMAS